MMVNDMKQRTKRHIVMFKLEVLGLLGRNSEKTKILREPGLFKNFGGGLASSNDSNPSGHDINR